MLIKGTDLTEDQKKLVLSSFPYRWTGENRARMRREGADMSHPEPIKTDEEWLASHSFHFIKDGSRLSKSKRWTEPKTDWIPDYISKRVA